LKIEQLKLLEKHELAPNLVPSNSLSFATSIKVHRDARLVKELLGGTDQINYFSKEWLFGQILALGGAAELIDPQLRAEFLTRVQASQNQYL
jgi:hypothetical protein